MGSFPWASHGADLVPEMKMATNANLADTELGKAQAQIDANNLHLIQMNKRGFELQEKRDRGTLSSAEALELDDSFEDYDELQRSTWELELTAEAQKTARPARMRP